MNIRLHANGTTIFNNQNISTNDFRIESVGETYNFFSDASTNRIGIGTNTPQMKLQINEAGGNSLNLVRNDGTTTTNEQLGGIGFDAIDGGVETSFLNSPASIVGFATEDFSTIDKGGYLTFRTKATNADAGVANVERMRIEADGDVGIGITNPTAKLQIDETGNSAALYVRNTSASTSGQLVNFQRTQNPGSANDILQITVPSTAPADFQFVEFDRGGNVEFAVDGDGDVDFNGALEPNGLPGTSGQFLRSNGANASPTWSAVSGDNLGNHTATTNLNMANFQVTNVDKVITRATSDYDKLRVYNSSNYTIGMVSGNTYGYLNDWAMTFTMNNDADRGWIWRDVNYALSDGAMSLTTQGFLSIKGKMQLTQSAGDEMVIINDDVWQHSTGNQDFGAGGDYFIMASREGSGESAGIFGDGNNI